MADQSSFSRVSLPDGTFSALFVLAILAAGWAVVMHSTGSYSAFQAKVLSAPWIYKPELFMVGIRHEGIVATLTCTAWVMLHVILALFVTGLSIFWAVLLYDGVKDGRITYRSRFPFVTARASSRTDRKINKGQTPTGRDMVKIPVRDCRIVISTAEKQTYLNVFPEYYMRMARAEPELTREPRGAIERLEVAILSMLLAHPDWPADPDGHHASTSLLDHTLAIRKDCLARLADEPLMGVVALAHDVGKLLAYTVKKTPNGKERWVKKSKSVDRLSAQVLRLTPEFWDLSEDDRTTVNVVLTYSHSPETMPRGTTKPRDRRILDVLRKADGVNTKQEQRQAVHVADRPDVIDAIGERLDDVFNNLNINQSLDAKANADGWSQPINGLLLVQAKAIRVNLQGLLGAEMERDLALRANDAGNAKHPALYAIRKALQQHGVILSSWKGFAPDLGLFEAKIGRMSFAGLFAIDLAVMRERMPDTVDHWGSSNYPVRVKTAAAKREGATG